MNSKGAADIRNGPTWWSRRLDERAGEPVGAVGEGPGDPAVVERDQELLAIEGRLDHGAAPPATASARSTHSEASSGRAWRTTITCQDSASRWDGRTP